jgi:hypothetical protein
MKSLSFTSKVWKWPGDIAWHFMSEPHDYYENIKKQFPKGMVKVVAVIGKTTWETSLFPHRKTKSFIIPIKQIVRKKENVWAGDELKIKIKFL